ncbi:MAG: saccharopine dehydrogenase NADP-binding domain-containing protein [Halieaceae bacterium]|nr:saccharopine dehydrogenase NADP-binding domain-containing protein [Halieaceae bacterium]
MAESPRDFDVVLYGATGFTGKLAAEYLLNKYGVDGGLRWAMAGRSLGKLEQVRDELQNGNIPLLTADSDEDASLKAMAEKAKVICTTVGPYALYGSKLVAACASTGTHYCDLTGETQWMRRMIDAHQADAEASGARIVHTCGFDSIPSDLGVLFLQNAMQAKHGVPAQHVKYRVVEAKGEFSGGTVASLINVMEEAVKDKSLRKLLMDPYALNPEGSPTGDDVNDQTGAIYDEDFERWTLPFVMAAINTRVVRRSNALLDQQYGDDFRYDEAMLGPKGMGALKAKIAAGAMTAGTAALAIGPLRAIAKRFLPKPGEGPSQEVRENGFYEILLHGIHPTDRDKDMVAKVTGDMDPGYGSTSKMLAESAVCLAKDELSCGGGFWTPASAMGEVLIARLEKDAGLTFDIVSGN